MNADVKEDVLFLVTILNNKEHLALKRKLKVKRW